MRNAKAKKINGRKIDDQEKYLRRMLLKSRRITPWREKEIRIRAAMAAKIV